MFSSSFSPILLDYSDPTCAEGFLPMDPKELRHSLKLTWESKDSLLTLSMRLTRDGFPRKETDVFLFAADAANDPVARMTWGCAV